LFIDPLSLPIAGLRTIRTDSAYPGFDSVPREILPFEYQPRSVFDLDEIVWRHIKEVVHGVGKATGKPITMDHYRSFGNTRRIPEWKDDPGIMEIHDAIVEGRHPDFFPYINEAFPDAVRTVLATERMGYGFVYQTSRPPGVIGATLRGMEWNQLPLNTKQKNRIDPFSDPDMKNGTVYCGDGLPMVVGRMREPKRDVVEYWLKNLREQGWKGQMVVVDDLQGPFEQLLKNRDIVGIALQGDVNASRKHVPGEIRVDSWRLIGEILMDIHKRAVAMNPSPYRIFEHQGRRLLVDKKAAGVGIFSLCTIPTDAWRWEDGESQPDVPEAFRRISHS